MLISSDSFLYDAKLPVSIPYVLMQQNVFCTGMPGSLFPNILSQNAAAHFSSTRLAASAIYHLSYSSESSHITTWLRFPLIHLSGSYIVQNFLWSLLLQFLIFWAHPLHSLASSATVLRPWATYLRLSVYQFYYWSLTFVTHQLHWF